METLISQVLGISLGLEKWEGYYGWTVVQFLKDVIFLLTGLESLRINFSGNRNPSWL